MEQIFSIALNRQDLDAPACVSSYPRSYEQDLQKCNHRTPDSKIPSIGLEYAPVGERRAMCDHIQDQVILFSIFVKSCRV